jgi:CRP/FNR family cyclic AMP-dependent transcriptional regulator
MISPELLRRYDLFAGLDPAVFKQIAMIGEEVDLAEGDLLFEEGKDADAFFLVVKGTIDIKMNLDEEGNRRLDVGTLIEGDITGWSALVPPYVYTLNAEAVTPVTVARLEADAFRALLDENCCELGYPIMTQLTRVLGERLNNIRVQFVSLIA